MRAGVVTDDVCATDSLSNEALSSLATYLKGPEVVQLASSSLALDLALGGARREAINKWLSDLEYDWWEGIAADLWAEYESGEAFWYEPVETYY